ncbi:hypothetical protein [Commensalibacter oyaizuii]|uniref:Lipoprotein n=1 Tax=Commensalibacter oyaizuii TaxID=3043873 RepID=A0ABT6Q142_9PROT|nr:hypothetical protein [Commensalibacter sp. TBRC 16381]MDI2090715.1 hypothetical protein [Commensalibacter sp. TBRC 16381]
MILSNALHKQTIKLLSISLGSSFFLWGCAEQVTYDFPPACPKVSVVPTASDYYEFADQKADISHLVTRASILGVEGSCIDDPKNASKEEKKNKKKHFQDKIDTTLSVTMQVQRGPAAQERHYRIPYFIATFRNGAIVEKKNLIATVDFPDNIDQTRIKSDKILFKIPATPARTPDGYELMVGFQLTPEQLSFNRNHFRSVQYTTY